MTITRFDRKELKFVVDAAQRRLLTKELRARLVADAHGDEEGRYPIISVYYDNADRDIYYESLQGVRSRRKLRIRVYGDEASRASASCFLEIKHRYGSRNVKRRVAMSIEDAMAVGRAELPELELNRLEALVVDEARRMVVSHGLKPTCVLRYDRQAFRGSEDEADLRVTFDDGVRARARDFQPVPDDQDFDVEILEPGESILEIKVDEVVPFWLAERLGQLGCTLQGNSKYRRSLEALGLVARIPTAHRVRWSADPIPSLEASPAPWTP